VPRTRRTLAVLALAVLLLTAGCSGAGGDAAGGGDYETGAETQAATGTPAATEAEGGASGDAERQAAVDDGGDGEASSVDALAQDRILIRTAEVRLRVDDYASARQNLTAAVRAQGGFVSDATREVEGPENRTFTRGRLVLRVPKENFSALYGATEAEGEVLSASQSTQDVTGQVVDLRARLDNLRAERDRLRTLYQRANETEDVLQVADRLSEVQGEIERTEARLQSLERRVAYSTITVELTEPRPEYDPPERSQWYDTPVTQAFLASVDGVVTTLRAVVVGVAYAAPYALAFGIPLVGLAMLVVRLR
jgi:hypothetical protein